MKSSESQTMLFPSQENYLSNLGNRPYMFCGTGAGKTRMAMFRAKRAGYDKVLVITPATVRDTRQWEGELEEIGLEFDRLQVEGFSFLQKFKTLDFTKYRDWYVIIDEAHKIKNSQSLQGMGAWKLCAAAGDYSLLSATPMSKWADAVNYAKITGLVTHKTEFYRRFVVEQKSFAHKGMDIVGYRDTDTLARWWNSIALRGRSEDFVELPSKQVIDIQIPIKRKGYIEMIKTRMRDDEPLDSAPKLNWALRQYAEASPEKLAWVVDKVDGLENCIVFVNTIAALEALSDKFTSAGIKHGLWFSGKKDRYRDHNVMIMQYQSGGTGLNLQKFNATIYLSPTYSYTDHHQAEGRTWRTGQTKRCTFYQLRATNTIDEAIYAALAEKRDFDDKLVGVDNVMEVLG
jgi:Superfamily II DNA/RNA helicases, SNF2 family